jgi:hypothetical protein
MRLLPSPATTAAKAAIPAGSSAVSVDQHVRQSTSAETPYSRRSATAHHGLQAWLRPLARTVEDELFWRSAMEPMYWKERSNGIRRLAAQISTRRGSLKLSDPGGFSLLERRLGFQRVAIHYGLYAGAPGGREPQWGLLKGQKGSGLKNAW